MKILVCVKQVPDAETQIRIAAADVAVIEELVSFLPLLIDACRKQRGYGKEAGL